MVVGLVVVVVVWCLCRFGVCGCGGQLLVVVVIVG